MCLISYKIRSCFELYSKTKLKTGFSNFFFINLGLKYFHLWPKIQDIISKNLKGRDVITNFNLNIYEVNNIMKSKITKTMDGIVTLRKEGSNNDTLAYPQK